MNEVQMDARKRRFSPSGGDIWFLLVVVKVEVSWLQVQSTLSAVCVLCVCVCAHALRPMGSRNGMVQSCDSGAEMLPTSPAQQSQWGHPSTKPQGFFLSDLIDCTNGHVAACTHVIQDPQMEASTDQHVSHTSQTHLFWAFPQSQHSSGRISPTAPTAFNQLGHEALQMGLSVGWDCRGRVGEEGGGGVGGGG